MLTILYPKEDYEAADLAIKAQAMSQMNANEEQSIYIVPKHYGRNREIVYKNLDQAKKVLFLAYDKTKIDKETKEELQYVIDKKKEIYFVIPENMKIEDKISASKNLHIIPYDKTGKQDAVTEMQELVANLHKEDKIKRHSDTDNFVLLLLGFLGILLLLLAFTSKNRS